MRYLFLYFFIYSYIAAEPSIPASFFWTKFIFGSFVMFITYQILLMPEKKRRRQAKTMIEFLVPGDTILTTGGIVGEIESISDNFITLKFPSGYSLVIIKDAVSGIVSADKFKG